MEKIQPTVTPTPAPVRKSPGKRRGAALQTILVPLLVAAYFAMRQQTGR